MKFELLHGRHRERVDANKPSKGKNIKTYVKRTGGPPVYVDSDQDLVEKYGANKFRMVYEVQAGKKAAKSKLPKTATDEELQEATDNGADELQAPANAYISSLGENVTDEFEGAEDAGLLVFKKNQWHYVATLEDPETALHKKAMHSDDVAEFIDANNQGE